MNTLKALTAFLPIFLFVPSAQSAERVVWDDNGVSSTPPKIIYSYKYGANSKVALDTAEIDDVPYYMAATFTLTGETSDYGAGFGFSWNAIQDDDYSLTPRATDLDSYKGVCLTYSSTNIVRMDFRQSGISADDGGDDNYFGTWLASTEGASINKFVAFEDLKMGWSGTWKLNKKKQLGLQFSYKGDKAKKYGSEAYIKITAVRIADECPQHAPEVNPYLDKEYRIDEGDSLVIHLSDVFRDLDGDKLTISGTWEGTGVSVNYDDTQARSLEDSLVFKTVKNPAATDSVVYTFTALDPSGKKASWVIGIKPIDKKHTPVVKAKEFDVYQGKTLTFDDFYGAEYDDQTQLSYDLDGDKYWLYLVDDEDKLPAFGEFTPGMKSGRFRSFTYVAPTDVVGDVSFFLYAMEEEDTESVSEPVEFIIHVLDVNDPPVVEFAEDDPTFNYTINGKSSVGTYNDPEMYIDVAEDFEDSIWVEINTDKVSFSDVDSKIKMGIKTDGIVNAEIVVDNRDEYILITSKKNANGLGKVTYYADDGEYQVGVDIYVKVLPVVDLPMANADEYDAVQGVKLSVSAKKGVLVNDENVDDPEAALVATVVDKPEHGTLSLKEDGSFTYKSDEDYRGEDSFTYICTNEDDIQSEPATVTIHVAGQNMPPVISDSVVKFVEESLATLVEDKLTSGKIFKLSDLNKWFEDPDNDKMTFDAKNEDGKLNVDVTTTSIKITPVADSSGESEVIIVATDTNGAFIEQAFKVFIKPVNDKPVAKSAEDAAYDVALTDWEMEIDLDSMVFDVDGDTLTYTLPKTNDPVKEFIKIELDGHVLKVSAQKKGLEPGEKYAVTVVAADSEYSVNLMLTFIAEGNAVALHGIVQPKAATWQNAVQASRGVAAIMDMQGRVMWTAKLPVSETEVRNASAKVQGRKVLRVDSQTWTIK